MDSDPITDNQNPNTPPMRNPWVDNLVRPLLLIVMIMCFNLSLVRLVQLLNPAWHGNFFLLGMLITTVEAIYSSQLLRSIQGRGIAQGRYRLVEGMILVMMLKLLTLIGQPLSQAWLEIQQMWADPLSAINLEFYITVVLGATAWTMATYTTDDFEDLLDPYAYRSDQLAPLDSLTSRFFWGGAILMIISGLSQIGLASLADFERPSLSGIFLNVFIYFVVGLGLLSQAHLSTLITRWQMQKISPPAGLVSRWGRYGLVVLGLLLPLVFLLPTGYSVGFLDSAALVFLFVLQLLHYLGDLIFFLMSIPFLWLMSLLSGSGEAGLSFELPTPQIAPPVVGDSSYPWLAILQSAIFWLVLAGVGVYLLWAYLDDRPHLRRKISSFVLLRLLGQVARWLWEQIRAGLRWGSQFGPNTEQTPGWNRPLASLKNVWNRVTGPQSARRQVVKQYLNGLRWAAKQGYPRPKHQTPHEYTPTLRQTTQAQAEPAAITASFIKARYSPAPIKPAEVEEAKKMWRAIQQQATSKSEKDKRYTNPPTIVD